MLKELSPWFEFTPCDWTGLHGLGIEKTVPPRTTIYTASQQADRIYLIKNGRVRLFHTTYDGKEKALIIMCNGTIIGDSLLNGQHFEGAITASETTYIEFGRKHFDELIHSNRQLLDQRMKILDQKAQTLALSNLLVACYDAETRIRYAIYHLANQFGSTLPNGHTRIFMSFTQQELADLVGTSRVTVANMINNFVQYGLIQKDGRFYILPSMSKILPDE